MFLKIVTNNIDLHISPVDAKPNQSLERICFASLYGTLVKKTVSE